MKQPCADGYSGLAEGGASGQPGHQQQEENGEGKIKVFHG